MCNSNLAFVLPFCDKIISSKEEQLGRPWKKELSGLCLSVKVRLITCQLRDVPPVDPEGMAFRQLPTEVTLGGPLKRCTWHE